RVDHEEGIWKRVHLADADQILLQLFALVIEMRALFLRQLLLGIRENRLELLEALDGATNGREIGERAAEPAVVHVEHTAAIRFFENRVLRLALRAHEQNAFALRGEIGNE